LGACGAGGGGEVAPRPAIRDSPPPLKQGPRGRGSARSLSPLKQGPRGRGSARRLTTAGWELHLSRHPATPRPGLPLLRDWLIPDADPARRPRASATSRLWERRALRTRYSHGASEMTKSSWSAGGRKRNNRSCPVRLRPTLERLEDRTLPALSGFAFGGLNYDPNQGATPPDTIIAAGPNHVVEAVNQNLLIASKANFPNSLSGT